MDKDNLHNEEPEDWCRAPSCLGTNWGGYDRLHLRDSNCPPYELNPAPNPIADFWESVRRGAKLTSRTEKEAHE